MGKSFKKIDPIAYQKYIDSYVVKHAYKPLVFVGLNVMPWWHKWLYYDLHANYKFYIKIDTKTILLQRFIRELTNVQKDKKAIDDLIKDNKKFLKLFHQFVDRELSMKTLVEHISTIEPNYKKQKYTFASRDSIFNTVCKLLTTELKK